MNLRTISFIFTLSFISFNTFAQPKFENFEAATTYLQKLVDPENGESITVYKGGYMIADMGAACAGRYLFKLQDVVITQNIESNNNRCGAGSQNVLNVSFECKNSGCILDPLMLEFEPGPSGGFSFFNIEKGLKFYNVLLQIQAFTANE